MIVLGNNVILHSPALLVELWWGRHIWHSFLLEALSMRLEEDHNTGRGGTLPHWRSKQPHPVLLSVQSSISLFFHVGPVWQFHLLMAADTEAGVWTLEVVVQSRINEDLDSSELKVFDLQICKHVMCAGMFHQKGIIVIIRTWHTSYRPTTNRAAPPLTQP